VLGVISSSPGRLEPVFEAIIANAVRICGGSAGMLALRDGDGFRGAAAHGFGAGFTEMLSRLHRPAPGTTLDLVEQEPRTVQMPDLLAVPAYDAIRALAPEYARVRSHLAVPMLKESVLLGAILIYREEVRPFDGKQVGLVENFAKQAVIAIENARLITETREALDQQTATAEVLGVINSSPGDLAPVFDAMLDKAMRLCEATFGGLTAFDGERFNTLALRGLPTEAVEAFREPWVAGPGSYHENLVRGEPMVHADLGVADPARRAHRQSRAIMEIGRARTGLLIALRKDERLLGSLFFYRQEVRPFTDKQIALLQNFAAQAVVAMENARLLNEIRQRQVELRVTFDNMADGVAMFDANLRLAAWNRNFQELLDLSDDFLAGGPTLPEYFRYLAARGEYSPDLEAQLSRDVAIADHEARFERTRPDGRIIEVRRNAIPGGGSVLIFSDITERKRSEEEIRAARDAAEASLRDLRAAQSSLIQAQKMAALGQLTAGIAHEIKNPLNFVNNFAGLSVELLDELKEVSAPAVAALDDDKRAEIDETIEMLTSNLEKISEHGQRADNIVKSMLEHSRGVSGERRQVNLNNLIDEALNLAYHGARAQDSNFNIGLEHDYAPMLKPIELVPQEITRVFLNLFGNGFYAAHKRAQKMGDPSFQPLLTVAIRDLGEAVEVRIRDNGVGIPPDIKDKLFQPFFTTKPTGEGTGLGLSISYDIVTQQHGGTIGVDSQVGEFTEFTILLPRQ
jgi:two-component system NtrC family sensor kinase